MKTSKKYKREWQRNWRKKNREKYKEANNKYQKKWQKRNKKKYKDSQLRIRYKISLEQFNQMLTSQHKQCAICGKKFKSGKNTHVDHNHKTMKVRQLLCTTCNVLLGNCKEDIVILEKAINYLKLWNTDDM